MTDHLTTAIERIDAERKRLSSARYVIENAMRFRDQAVRLGFEPETMANHTGFGMWVPFHDELTAALAVGGVVPPGPEVVEPVEKDDPHDAGKPWPAIRDDYQPPAPVEQAAEPTGPRSPSVGQSGGGDAEALPPREVEKPATPLPPIKDPRGKQVEKPAVREGWTSEDEADLIERLNRGEVAAQIAEATGRKVKAVAGKITYMRSRGLLVDQQLAKPVPQPKPVTTTVAKPAEPVARPAPAQITTAPAHDDDDEANFWTDARKLTLTECLLRGMKMIDAADEVGCSDAEAKEQWKALYPGPGLDDQQKLLKRLRAKVEQVAA